MLIVHPCASYLVLMHFMPHLAPGSSPWRWRPDTTGTSMCSREAMASWQWNEMNEMNEMDEMDEKDGNRVKCLKWKRCFAPRRFLDTWEAYGLERTRLGPTGRYVWQVWRVTCWTLEVPKLRGGRSMDTLWHTIRQIRQGTTSHM